jgi:hypothetical protein
VLLSGIELELELAGGVAVDWSVLAGGVDVSELGGVLGVLDCIELSVLGGAAVSEPVACSFEQPAASVSALRHRIIKPRFMGAPRLSWIGNRPVTLSSGICGYNVSSIAVFRGSKRELPLALLGQRPFSATPGRDHEAFMLQRAPPPVRRISCLS